MKLTYTEAQHLEVLDQALEIFRERNKVRGDLWAESPIDKQLDMAMEKIKRVMHNYYHAGQPELEPLDLDTAVDDGLDAINFLTFAVRLMTGKIPDAPQNKN